MSSLPVTTPTDQSIQADVLKREIDNRFAGFDPVKFENFIATLFRATGYQVDLTPKSGDLEPTSF